MNTFSTPVLLLFRSLQFKIQMPAPADVGLNLDYKC